MSILSRIGNNLFRMGCYLEKAEQMTGYTRGHYLHYLDAAYPAYKEDLLESLLEGLGLRQSYFVAYKKLEEQKVLSFIAIDKTNPAAIRQLVAMARELARSTRDEISVALWEYINAYYHAVNSYNKAKLKHPGFQQFAKEAMQFSLTIKGYTQTLMLQDESWGLLAMGFHLERSIQSSRLLLSKMKENKGQENTGQERTEKNVLGEPDHLIALLQSSGSYEAYKKIYQGQLSREKVMNFMVFHPAFPGAVLYNLHAIQKISRDVGLYSLETEDSPLRPLRQLLKDFQMHEGKVSGEDRQFLQKVLASLEEMAGQLEEKHLVV